MDPLSITASAVTLIQATSAVSTTLYKLVSTFRSADAKVSALCHELGTLINFLETVKRTLEECQDRPLSLASMDENLWRQSVLSLEDCKTTIAELEAFIERIKTVAKSTGIFRRAKIAVDLTMYSRDISAFQEKINKSNWALQTMLSAINVSFSLRSDVAQDTILYELESLKLTIEQSLQVSLHHSDGLSHALRDPSGARLAHNLRTLARVAQNFHSNASSVASTIYGSNSVSPNVPSDTATSIQGGSGLTPGKQQQIDRYFKSMRRTAKRKSLAQIPAAATPRTSSPPPAISSEEDESNASEIGYDNDEGDDEAYFELLFLNGLEEVAKESMIGRDFAKAETILEKAIQRRTGSSSGDSDFKKLQIQLAICYFFQHKWRLAEPLITNIAKSKASLDRVVCNLLHALALAHLGDYSFDKSIAICKQALQGKRRLRRAFGVAHDRECNETLGLLATIYETKGEPMYAEVLRRTMTARSSYEHPLNELEFLAKHPNLSQEVLGEAVTLDWGPELAVEQKKSIRNKISNAEGESTIEDMVETLHNQCREGKGRPQTLRAKLELNEKYNKDTDKEIVVALIPSSVSNSCEELVRTDSGYSSMASSRPKSAPNRSLTRRVTRFLSTAQITPGRSPDVSDTPSTSSSPVPRKLGKSFWSKSNTNVFGSRILSRRRRCKFERCDKEEAGTVGNRFGEYKWAGIISAFNKTKTRSVTTDGTLSSLYKEESLEMLDVPELGSLEVHEMIDTSHILEMPSTSLAAVTSTNRTNGRHSGLTSSPSLASLLSRTQHPQAKLEGTPKTQTSRKLQRPSPDTTSSSSRRWLKKGFWSKSRLNLLSQKRSKALLITKENDERVKAWLGIGSDNYSYDGYLPVDIDNSGSLSAQKERGDSEQDRNRDSAISISETSSPANIIAKVLYDFQGENNNELAVKKNEIIQIIKRSSQGWLLVQKDRKMGFVPASYVDTNLPKPEPVTAQTSTMLDQAPKRLSRREYLAINESKSKSKEAVAGSEHVDESPRVCRRQEARLSCWSCDAERGTLHDISEDPDAELQPVDVNDSRFSWRSNDSELFTSAAWNLPEDMVAATLPFGKTKDKLPVLCYPGQLREQGHRKDTYLAVSVYSNVERY